MNEQERAEAAGALLFHLMLKESTSNSEQMAALNRNLRALTNQIREQNAPPSMSDQVKAVVKPMLGMAAVGLAGKGLRKAFKNPTMKKIVNKGLDMVGAGAGGKFQDAVGSFFG